LHDWALNVRELENVVRLLLALHTGEPILRRKHLPPELQLGSGDGDGAGGASLPASTRRQDDLQRLRSALDETGGNLKRAAELSGISRQRAYRLIGSDERPRDAAPNVRQMNGPAR
jgi:DNA-binding NtrC family response regulator